MQLNTGDIAGAEHAYRLEFGPCHPGFAQARINLGLLLERKGQFDDAMLAVESGGCVGLFARLGSQCRFADLGAQSHWPLARAAQTTTTWLSTRLTQSLQLNPKSSLMPLQHWVHLRSKQCKWPAMQAMPECVGQRHAHRHIAIGHVGLAR